MGENTEVVFAVIRIVTALFLKETLESTANDADILIESQRHDANKLRHRLETLFEALDEDGDGMLSPEEFESAMSLTSVQQYMQALDVRMSDCQCLFTILDDGDGRITIAEFCKGLKQVKGQARAIDMVVLQHETEKLGGEISFFLIFIPIWGRLIQLDFHISPFWVGEKFNQPGKS